MANKGRVVSSDGKGREDAHVFELGGGLTEDFLAVQSAPQPVVETQVVVPVPPQQPAAAPTAPTVTVTDIVRTLRERLKVVNREIRLRHDYEEERDQIKRLLKAAKDKNATVHTIRRAAS